MTGTKSRQETHVYPTYITVKNNVSGQTYRHPSSQEGTFSSITEHGVDGWRKSIRTNAVIINAMDREIWSGTAGEGSIHESFSQFGVDQSTTGDFAGLVRNAFQQPSLAPDTSELRRAEANAIIKAMAKVNGSESFAGETLATLGDTVSMLRKPYSGVQRLLKQIFKKQKRKLKSGYTLGEASASAWLETRYGWKPLMMDIELIMNSIVGIHQQLKRRVIVRGGGVVPEKTSDHHYSARLPGDLGRMVGSGVITRSEKIRAHAGVIIDIKPMSTLDMVMKVFGFRGRDLPATIWALTPLSFVLDWFSDIEGWLTAIIPDPDVIYRGSWVTSVCEVQLDYSGGTIDADPLYPGISGPNSGFYGPSTVKSVTIVRTPNVQVPNMPVLTSDNLSLIHQVDGVSLLTGSILNSLKKLQH